VAKKTSADYPGDPTADKYLVYVPEHVTYAMASVAVGNANVILQQSWSGKRFTSSDNAMSLSGYSITSAAVRYPLPLAGWRLSLKGEVSNVFNASYQVIDGYPMPFREFRGTLGVIL
jgi:outer membrane cobalamin receptor